MPYVNIYLHTNPESVAQAAVRSQSAPDPIQFPMAVLRSWVDYKIYPVDGNGDFDSAFKSDVASMSVAVGKADGSPLSSSTSWTSITDGFSGSISYGTAALITEMGNQEYIDAFFEIQVTSNSTSHAATVLQAPMIIRNRVNSP